jgi:hypothetical protein
MTGPKAVTASFLLAPKAKVIDTGYTSLLAAYLAAAASEETDLVVMALDSEMPDNSLFIDSVVARGKTVTIKGGYYADYSKGRSGLPTKLKGPLRISSGTLRVDRLTVH